MAIRIEIVKSMLAHSGNCCAFPGCKEKIVDDNHKIVGELAHIEGAKKGSARYNEIQTDNERNGYDNLIYLCRKHHREIDNNPSKYSTLKIKSFKYSHESEYEDDQYIFDLSKIIKANEDLKLYFKQVEIANKNNKDELKFVINSKENFFDILKDIKKEINYLSYNIKNIKEYCESLNDNIVKYLKMLKIDINVWNDVFYTDNPFYNPFWEFLNLGYNNTINEIEIKLIQLEILYYSEYLKLNDDKEVKLRLKILKGKLLDIAKNAIYMD